MDSAKHILAITDIALYQCYMMLAIQQIDEAIRHKITVFRGHFNSCLLLYQLFMAFAVILQIPNGNEFDIPLLCQLHQLRRTHHGTILTHDFAAQPTFLQACQSA